MPKKLRDYFKNKVRRGLLVFLIWLAIPLPILAAKPLDIVINEIAWMGTAGQPDREWIELYNNRGKEINISGWEIENAGRKHQSLKISQGKIPAKGFFLICKRKLANCNLISSRLSLTNNYGDNGRIVLRDGLKNNIDQTPRPEERKWPAGQSKSGLTMERINPAREGDAFDNWQDSQFPGGTPKAKNYKPLSKRAVFYGRGQLLRPSSQPPLLPALFLALSLATASLFLKIELKKRL